MCQIKEEHHFLSLMGQELLTSSWKCLNARAPTGASFLTCLQRCTTPTTWMCYIRCDRVNYQLRGQCVGGGGPGRVFLDTQLSEQNTETGADRRSMEAQELPSVNSGRKGGKTRVKRGRMGRGAGMRQTAWWRTGKRKRVYSRDTSHDFTPLWAFQRPSVTVPSGHHHQQQLEVISSWTQMSQNAP